MSKLGDLVISAEALLQCFYHKEGGVRQVGASILDPGKIRIAAGEAGLVPRVSESEEELRLNVYRATQWAQCGFPTFDVTPGLASSLLLTDSSAVNSDELKLPFPCFAIQLPFPDSPFRADFPSMRQAPISHVWCSTLRGVEDPDEANGLYNEIQRIKQNGGQAARLTTLVGRALTIDREARSQLCIHLSSDHGGLWMRQYVPSESGTLEEWLDYEGPYLQSPLVVEDRDNVALQAAKRLVVNLAIYIGSQKADGTSGLGDPNRTTKINAIKASPTVWLLGAGIKLPKEMHEAAKDSASIGRRVAWQLSKRFVVRGHWRMQAHGEGRILRKRMWIEPHWKGLSAAEGIIRIFEVDQKKI